MSDQLLLSKGQQPTHKTHSTLRDVFFLIEKKPFINNQGCNYECVSRDDTNLDSTRVLWWSSWLWLYFEMFVLVVRYFYSLIFFGSTVSSVYNCLVLSRKISSYYTISGMVTCLEHLPRSPIHLGGHVHLVKAWSIS